MNINKQKKKKFTSTGTVYNNLIVLGNKKVKNEIGKLRSRLFYILERTT